MHPWSKDVTHQAYVYTYITVQTEHVCTCVSCKLMLTIMKLLQPTYCTYIHVGTYVLST